MSEVQFDSRAAVVRLLLLHLGFVAAAAQGVWIIFGAFGLACLPFAWLKRPPSTEQQQQQLQHAIAAIREQQRLLQVGMVLVFHAPLFIHILWCAEKELRFLSFLRV